MNGPTPSSGAMSHTQSVLQNSGGASGASRVLLASSPLRCLPSNHHGLGHALDPTHPPDRRGFCLAWSAFRRRHQAVARRCHAARRARQQPDPQSTLTVQVLSRPTLALTEARWERIAPLLPPQKPPTGRPAHDHRTMLAGMHWVVRTGSAWRDLPAHFGLWETVHRRYHRWRKAGIWQQILETLAHDEPSNAA